jgi:hypothetical protein
MRISTVESLDQLLDKLQSLYNEQESYRDDDSSYNIFEEHRIDLTNLLTFGGVEPDSTAEILSWDKDRYLICDDKLGFKIVSRKFLDSDDAF